MEIIMPTTSKFPLGDLLMTVNAERWLSTITVTKAIARHAAGDWGEVCAEDAGLNDHALRHGGRLFSEYTEGPVSFWIITEADRSGTTVLLPEYH